MNARQRRRGRWTFDADPTDTRDRIGMWLARRGDAGVIVILAAVSAVVGFVTVLLLAECGGR